MAFSGAIRTRGSHSWFLSSASLGHLSWRTWAALLCRQWLQPLVLRQKSSVYQSSGEQYEMFREGAWDAHSSSRGARKIWLSLLKTPKLYPHKGSLWMEGGGGLGLSNCPLNPATGLDRWWCTSHVVEETGCWGLKKLDHAQHQVLSISILRFGIQVLNPPPGQQGRWDHNQQAQGIQRECTCYTLAMWTHPLWLAGRALDGRPCQLQLIEAKTDSMEHGSS